MTPVSGHSIGKQILEILGLDYLENVKSINLNVSAEEVVTCEITYYPGKDEIVSFSEFLIKGKNTKTRKFVLQEDD